VVQVVREERGEVVEMEDRLRMVELAQLAVQAVQEE